MDCIILCHVSFQEKEKKKQKPNNKMSKQNSYD